jgi:predicted Co/Zn/Cd cation transporter (cation efflux family)
MFSKKHSTMKTIVERILIVCLFCCLSPLVSFSQIQTIEVLKDGSREMIQAFGIAHSAIGLTIPIVIISSGIAANRGFPRPSSRPRQGSP